MVQFAQRVPNITQEKTELLVVEETCFTCHKPGNVARDCMQQRERPTCYRCNKVGHIAPNCEPGMSTVTYAEIRDMLLRLVIPNKHLGLQWRQLVLHQGLMLLRRQIDRRTGLPLDQGSFRRFLKG